MDDSRNAVVTLLFEEYEALRLCDHDMFNHHQACEIMCVSRPTFTRIYAKAREKIAKALVEGCQITIEGGKIYFDSDWYHCQACTCYFNNPEREHTLETCPLCKSHAVVCYKPDEEFQEDDNGRLEDVCICPECGYEILHEYCQPCGKQICPKCNARMTRLGTPGRGRKHTS